MRPVAGPSIRVPVSQVAAGLNLPPAVVGQEQRLLGLAGPRVKQLVRQMGPVFDARAKMLPPNADLQRLAESEVRGRFQGLGNQTPGDIEAIAFLVLMQSAKSAQEDLKAIMGKVKSINHQKASIREHLKAEEEQDPSIRIQLMMDRYAKMMTVLSNLSRRLAKTSDTMLTNLK